ncbi:MAG: nicotinate-nucleotide adenylyltransferase [Deltaproteobacteria bacterium]|nr:nicotinate-nucleotide adenylyltransferase [Deltaproteobacteria bacterium]NIS77956.1 nicotinate-nucleotide adenylyltransferase [Deltaproteobacteria bacterium]
MRYRYGMIHGRFQPFHLEHLRYFRMAWEQSERVLIGITNPDQSTIIEDDLSSHRHLPEENPYTYTERLIMIADTLREEGYDMDRIYIIPFPIHHPDRWKHYIPEETALFVVAYSPWERQKAKRLGQAGFNVILIEGLEKGISGQQIRSIMASGGRWQHLVPSAVARHLEARRPKGN